MKIVIFFNTQYFKEDKLNIIEEFHVAPSDGYSYGHEIV